MPALGSDSDSFYGSSYPASTSPNLPFAFTPSQHSYASMHDPQAGTPPVRPAARRPLAHTAAHVISIG